MTYPSMPTQEAMIRNAIFQLAENCADLRSTPMVLQEKRKMYAWKICKQLELADAFLRFNCPRYYEKFRRLKLAIILALEETAR